MAKKRAWDLARQRREMRKWLDDPQVAVLVRDRAKTDLANGLVSVVRPMVKVSLAAELLSDWEGAAGALAILDGDDGGWSTLRTAVLLRAWKVRALVGLCDQGFYQEIGAIPLDCETAALPLAGAIALGDDAFADWFGPRLLAFARDGKEAFQSWKSAPFATFVVELYALWRGLPRPESGLPDCRVRSYRKLLDNWDDPDRIGEGLGEACDYHCAHAGGYDLFFRHPYNVFPAEVLAVRRVRRELGLPTPEVPHPLLDSPLAAPPESIPLRDEDARLLDDIRYKALIELPGVGELW